MDEVRKMRKSITLKLFFLLSVLMGGCQRSCLLPWRFRDRPCPTNQEIVEQHPPPGEILSEGSPELCPPSRGIPYRPLCRAPREGAVPCEQAPREVAPPCPQEPEPCKEIHVKVPRQQVRVPCNNA